MERHSVIVEAAASRAAAMGGADRGCPVLIAICMSTSSLRSTQSHGPFGKGPLTRLGEVDMPAFFALSVAISTGTLRRYCRSPLADPAQLRPPRTVAIPPCTIFRKSAAQRHFEPRPLIQIEPPPPGGKIRACSLPFDLFLSFDQALVRRLTLSSRAQQFKPARTLFELTPRLRAPCVGRNASAPHRRTTSQAWPHTFRRPKRRDLQVPQAGPCAKSSRVNCDSTRLAPSFIGARIPIK